MSPRDSVLKAAAAYVVAACRAVRREAGRLEENDTEAAAAEAAFVAAVDEALAATYRATLVEEREANARINARGNDWEATNKLVPPLSVKERASLLTERDAELCRCVGTDECNGDCYGPPQN